jgi:predicted esterase
MKRALTAAVILASVGLIALSVWTRSGRDDGHDDLIFEPFVASDGTSSRFHLFRQGVPVGAPGLLVEFHGDGAFEFFNPDSAYALGGPHGIVASAREHGLLTLVALTPDRRGTLTWWEDGPANAVYAHELVASVIEANGVDRGDVWLVGYSGGAQFITEYFLPTQAGLIEGGGSVVFGGGGAPKVDTRNLGAELPHQFKMHWYTGEADRGTPPEHFDALHQAREGRSWYKDRGFDTTLDSPRGIGHDHLPFGRVVDAQLTQPRTTTR